MGLFDRKSTSSSTQNTTNMVDESLNGIGDGALAASGNSQINQYVTAIDQGAIKTASDAFSTSAATIGKAIEVNNIGVKTALAMAGDNSNSVIKLARDAGEGAFNLAHSTQKNTNAMAAEMLQQMNQASSAAISAAASANRDALAANKATQDSAFAFTAKANEGIAKTAFEAIGMASHITGKNSDLAALAAKNNSELAQLAIGQVKGAWNDANQAQANKTGGDYRMLMWALAAVVGLVAVKSFGGK